MILDVKADVPSCFSSYLGYAGRVAPVVHAELGGDSARRDSDSRPFSYTPAGLYTSRGHQAGESCGSLDVLA